MVKLAEPDRPWRLTASKGRGGVSWLVAYLPTRDLARDWAFALRQHGWCAGVDKPEPRPKGPVEDRPW